MEDFTNNSGNLGNAMKGLTSFDGRKPSKFFGCPHEHDGYNPSYKGSAWAPAFAGAHASGRAGQHFDNLRCSCPIYHALNFKVMPRV